MEFLSLLHLKSMKHLFIILLVTVAATAMAQDDFEMIEIHDPYKDICIFPSQGFTEIYCKTVLVSSSGAGGGLYLSSVSLIKEEEVNSKSINWDLLKNNMIISRKEFRAFREHIDMDVDWRSEKISFYTNSSTYKFGSLESDYLLTGISISEDGKTLSLKYQSTFHGVCQGIAQQAEWFTHESSTYAIIIPSTVENIICSSCYFGPDCSEVP